MKLTRRQLNILIESLLYEASPYPYMSSPEEIAELEYERTGINPNIKAVEEEFEEAESEKSAIALLDILFAAIGIKLSLVVGLPMLIPIAAAVISGALSVQGAYKTIVKRFLGNKELLDQVPDKVSILLGIDDEVLELLDDDLVEELASLYSSNVLTPAFEARGNTDNVIPISEYLDMLLREKSNNQLGLVT